jgi:hypothetical protein
VNDEQTSEIGRLFHPGGAAFPFVQASSLFQVFFESVTRSTMIKKKAPSGLLI